MLNISFMSDINKFYYDESQRIQKEKGFQKDHRA